MFWIFKHFVAAFPNVAVTLAKIFLFLLIVVLKGCTQTVGSFDRASFIVSFYLNKERNHFLDCTAVLKNMNVSLHFCVVLDETPLYL